MAGAPKGNRNNPKGRPKGVPNKVARDVKEILKDTIEDLAPIVRAKLMEIENPKDFIHAFAKIVEFVIPKAAPIDPHTTDDDLKTLMAMAAKEAREMT